MTLALGIIGTTIALLALVITVLEWGARRRADAAERKDRTKEIELVRRQVEASERQAALGEAASEAARSADVRVKGGGRDGLGWSCNLVNTGPAAATRVKAWIVRPETSAQVGPTFELSTPLLAGEESGRNVLIPLPETLIQERPPLRLMLSWVDTRERERLDEYPVNL